MEEVLFIERQHDIEYKVFNEENIKEIINYFYELKRDLVHKYVTDDQKSLESDNFRLYLKIEFKDGSIFDKNDKSMLDQIKKREIKDLRFSLSSYPVKASVSFTASEDYSNFSVESDDINWVDAKFMQLKEMIDLMPNQNYWFSRKLPQTFLNLTLATAFSFGLFFGILPLFIEIKSGGLNFSLLYLFTFSFLLIFSGLMSFFYKLYPKIEFATNNNYLSKKKKVTKFVYVFITVIVIPIIVGLVVNFLSKVLILY